MKGTVLAISIALLSCICCLTSRTASATAIGGQLAFLPDNPCGVLTVEQVSAATGLEVTDVRRVPSIRKIVQAERDGREPGPGIICSYETRTEFGAIYIVVPPSGERTTAGYRLAREKYFGVFPGSAKIISGLGEDAWMSGGTSLHVLVREDQYFIVGTQMYSRRSGDLLISLARAVLDRF